jgi:hypothetical protein
MSFSLIIKTQEDLAAGIARAALVAAIDAHVEAQARAMGYNSAAACAGYRESTVPDWAGEATAFIAWRDAVWQAAFALQAQYAAAQVVPPEAEVLAQLPVWGS